MFPLGFRGAVQAVLQCAKRDECLLSHLGDEILFYIMNKCGWDWFGTVMREELSEELSEEETNRRERTLTRMNNHLIHVLGVSEDFVRNADPRQLDMLHNQLAAMEDDDYQLDD